MSPTAFAFDPFDYAVQEDPYPYYRVLRDQFPAYYNEVRGFWALSRYDTVKDAARNWQDYSSGSGVDFDPDLDSKFGRGVFIATDPPLHDKLRGVVRRSFSPRAMAAAEDRFRSDAGTLLDSVVEGGTTDLAHSVTNHLPIITIARVVGFPMEDVPTIQDWLAAFETYHPADEAARLRSDAAADELHGYLGELLRERERRPRGDVLSEIAVARVDGRRIVEERIGMAYLLLLAGIETTTSLLSNAVWLLHRHPDQRRLLATDPARIPSAVEEVVRFEAPVQNLVRTTSREVLAHNLPIPAGETVVLLWGSANHDDRAFPDGDTFDVTRPPRRHLGFGEGLHFCLGAPLARIEGRVFLEELLARAPNYEVVGSVGRARHHNIRSILHMEVDFSGA